MYELIQKQRAVVTLLILYCAAWLSYPTVMAMYAAISPLNSATMLDVLWSLVLFVPVLFLVSIILQCLKRLPTLLR